MIFILLSRVRHLDVSPWAKVTFMILSLLLFTLFTLEAEANARMTERVAEISIVMNEDDWDTLRHTARSTEVLIPICGAGPAASPYEYLPAAVTVDGVTLENVGVRAKGFWGSINPVRPSLWFGVMTSC